MNGPGLAMREPTYRQVFPRVNWATRHGAQAGLNLRRPLSPKNKIGACIMFGVRIFMVAAALFGAGAILPLDLAEAKPKLSAKQSHAHHWHKAYSKQQTRSAYAKHRARKFHAQRSHENRPAKLQVKASAQVSPRPRPLEAKASASFGPRPARWCGWWMRTQKGGGPELNLARNWANWGRPSGPQVGAVVVWPHHVGVITGRAANGQWIVKSGNDGGRVRERPRSVAGAVFRTDGMAS
jgi:hypothetical protein